MLNKSEAGSHPHIGRGFVNWQQFPRRGFCGEFVGVLIFFVVNGAGMTLAWISQFTSRRKQWELGEHCSARMLRAQQKIPQEHPADQWPNAVFRLLKDTRRDALHHC